jgi:hypothetical protein
MNIENPFGPQPIKNSEEIISSRTLVNGKMRPVEELTLGENGEYIEPKIYQEDLEKYNSIALDAEVMYKDPATGEYIRGVVINKDDETYQVFVGQKGPSELDSSYGVAIPLEDIHLQGNQS